MSQQWWVDITTLGDSRGELACLEGETLPFDVKRIYYLYALNVESQRGAHAHYKTRQLAICVSGQCTMVMDDGIHQFEYVLDDPARGLLIEPLIWHEMHDFSSDCVLLVLADDIYRESDYMRNFAEFKKFIEIEDKG